MKSIYLPILFFVSIFLLNSCSKDSELTTQDKIIVGEYRIAGAVPIGTSNDLKISKLGTDTYQAELLNNRIFDGYQCDFSPESKIFKVYTDQLFGATVLNMGNDASLIVDLIAKDKSKVKGKVDFGGLYDLTYKQLSVNFAVSSNDVGCSWGITQFNKR